jgi:NADPH2:quinone reductase
MEAIRVTQFGDPEVLIPTTLEAPILGSDTQVLVEIQAAGVNPVDTYIRSGQYGRLPQLPYTPGLDGAGVVTAVGAQVTSVQVGDRVYGGWPITGTYAQFALYDSAWVFPLADPLSFEQGACIFVPYSTAYRALFHKGQAQAPGNAQKTVLVHGATGAVGLAAVQLAVAAGLRVIATGGSPAGRDLVAAQGAAVVLDHHSDNYGSALLEATEGQGVDVIIEMLANVNLGHDLTWLAPGGRVVVVGNRGTVTLNPRDIMAKDSTITAVNLFNTPAETLQRLQSDLYSGFSQGTLSPVVRQSLPLGQAAVAHQRVLEAGGQGNWVLVP